MAQVRRSDGWICAHAFQSATPATRFLSISVHSQTRPSAASIVPSSRQHVRPSGFPPRRDAQKRKHPACPAVPFTTHVAGPLLTAPRCVQSVRRYATEAPKQGSNAALYGALALGAAAGGYWYLSSSGVPASQSVPKSTATPSLAFKGGDQGFVSLVLEEVENINHNTKRFRFKLPEADNVSGLHVACAFG